MTFHGSRMLALALAAGLTLASFTSFAQAQDAADLVVRQSRMENQLRQMSGQIEKLQFENQRLTDQLARFQKDVDFRLQELGGKEQGGARAPSARAAPPAATAPPASQPPVQQRRGDAFDPSVSPQVSGVPRPLGQTQPSAPIEAGSREIVPRAAPGASVSARSPGAIESIIEDEDAIGTPVPVPGRGGPARATPGNPLDLSGGGPTTPRGAPSASISATGSPRSDYDLAYAAVQRQEYEAGEMAFRQFLQAHPRSTLVPDATYWLGETYYMRGLYREAAEQYLKISTQHPQAGKAPDSLLKLGMSLNAIGAKEQACSTFREVDRKYPNATANVKRRVEAETKRARCVAA